MKGMILTVAVCLAPMTVQAAMLTGNDIYPGCDEKAQPVQSGLSLGYILGVTDNLRLTGTGELKSCIPDSVSYGQINDVACAYLRENPKTRHVSATMLIRDAMRRAWPCLK